MKLVSIIVPVYNAEKYIKNCVLSILNQDYKNIELILVNDGSKDNSYNICKQLAEKDNRIRLFNKENGGTSSARNYGLDNAKGEYVCFIDSDDFACPNYVTTLLAATQNADMGIGGFKEVKEKKLAKACRVKYEKKPPHGRLLFAGLVICAGGADSWCCGSGCASVCAGCGGASRRIPD